MDFARWAAEEEEAALAGAQADSSDEAVLAPDDDFDVPLDDGDEPAGFVHNELGDPMAQGLRGQYPFLGFPLRELDRGLHREAMVWLREWVYWFSTTYRLDSKFVSPCWFLHSDVVEFLWAAANAEMVSSHNDDASNAVFTQWHSYFPALKDRLKNGSHRKCSEKGTHQEMSDYRMDGRHPFDPREDEKLWGAYLNQVEDEQKNLSPGQWRAVIRDEQEFEYFSEPVTIQDSLNVQNVMGKPVIFNTGEGISAASISASVAGAERVSWQKRDESGQWTTAQKSARDVRLNGEDE